MAEIENAELIESREGIKGPTEVEGREEDGGDAVVGALNTGPGSRAGGGVSDGRESPVGKEDAMGVGLGAE